MSTIPPEDTRALRRDKYGDDPNADMADDLARLAAGEPLAYIIGWIPFLGLRIALDSRPLIPRPETEWWTEKLIAHLREKFDGTSFTLLDLCAGSGAIGLAVLQHLPNAHVTFAELSPKHAMLIQKNLENNGLEVARASIHSGDLFAPVAGERFDSIASNPPYIPANRELPQSVLAYEPPEALFAGQDGLSVIERIAREAAQHTAPSGELWLECDIANAKQTKELLLAHGATSASLFPDQYGRDRLVVAYYP